MWSFWIICILWFDWKILKHILGYINGNVVWRKDDKSDGLCLLVWQEQPAATNVYKVFFQINIFSFSLSFHSYKSHGFMLL